MSREIVQKELVQRLISLALAEDVGSGDVTTGATIQPFQEGKGLLLAREELVVCGHEVAREVFRHINDSLKYEIIVPDGTKVEEGKVFASVVGTFASILTAERVVLNFLQRLSGVATKTRKITEQVVGTGVRILDTRKTTPGWRTLEKYAVTIGGGHNHREGLFDAVLIKNNHIDALGGDIGMAVMRCRELVEPDIPIEVEVRNLRELEQALHTKPDAILLDNMSPDEVKLCVEFVRNQGVETVELEASGGINEANVSTYAETGINSISIGAITHSVHAADISLRYEK